MVWNEGNKKERNEESRWGIGAKRLWLITLRVVQVLCTIHRHRHTDTHIIWMIPSSDRCVNDRDGERAGSSFFSMLLLAALSLCFFFTSLGGFPSILSCSRLLGLCMCVCMVMLVLLWSACHRRREAHGIQWAQVYACSLRRASERSRYTE